MKKTTSQKQLIHGIIEASKYLGITRKTVHILIKEKVFPEPYIVQPIGKRIFKIWEKSVLDNFRSNLRPPHRPKSVTKSNFNLKSVT